MRPRSSLKLVLTGTLPLALSACNQAATDAPAPVDTTVKLLVKSTFATLRECAVSQIPMPICSLANSNAKYVHLQNTPRSNIETGTQTNAQQGECQHTEQQNLTAQVQGFELIVAGSVSRAEFYKIREPLLQAGAVRTEQAVSKEAELVLASLLSGGESTKFYSQPVYGTCNNRPMSSSPRLIRSFTNGSLITRPSSTSTISRGGFGDQAKARSGWGSSSSSRFSFGG